MEETKELKKEDLAAMQFTLFCAGCTQVKENTRYPNRVEITNPEEMAAALAYDHVCAAYQEDMRKEKNYLWSNVIMLDCDNDHSEDPNDWVNPAILTDLLPEVCFATAPSRNNGKEKNGKPARPRFHAYFPVARIEDAEACAKLKKQIYEAFPFFDRCALDAARFTFGTAMGPEDILWQEGSRCIDELCAENAGSMAAAEWMNWESDPGASDAEKATEGNLMETDPEDLLLHDPSAEGEAGKDTSYRAGPIPVGKRNNTLVKYAAYVLTRHGDTERAKRLFDRRAADCEEPLEDAELQSIWTHAQKYFHETIEKQPGYLSPEEFRNRYGRWRPSTFDDIGFAEVFAEYAEEKLLFTPHTFEMLYSGTRWKERREGAVQIMTEFLDAALADALQVKARIAQFVTGDPNCRRVAQSTIELFAEKHPEKRWVLMASIAQSRYENSVRGLRFHKEYKNVIHNARHRLLCEYTDMDTQPYLLNTPKGTFDLRKGMEGFRACDPRDRITKVTACGPGEQGRELWEASLQATFCGDQELIEYVQLVVGMAAIGEVEQEGLILPYGTGRNGKSTFWNTVGEVLGDYARKTSAEILLANTRFNTRPEIAELKGRRLAIASELEEGSTLSTAAVKRLTSTDPITGERKYKDPIEFKPSHTMVLYTNHLPKVTELDEGTWRRMKVIPFNAYFDPKNDTLNYTAHLVKDAGPYIMKWIIEGAQKAIACDFKFPEPQCVIEATAKYRASNNWVLKFLDECAERDSTAEAEAGKAYQEYRSWCYRNGENPVASDAFREALISAGFPWVRHKTGRFHRGLRLREAERQGFLAAS